jgi:hypothetical protein
LEYLFAVVVCDKEVPVPRVTGRGDEIDAGGFVGPAHSGSVADLVAGKVGLQQVVVVIDRGGESLLDLSVADQQTLAGDERDPGRVRAGR